MTLDETKAVAIRAVEIVSDGTREEFDTVFHADFYEREADPTVEPSAAGGPEDLWATAQSLRCAFADMHHDLREVVAEGELVTLFCVASGCHTGEVPIYDEHGVLMDVVAATGKPFVTAQTHWVRVKDGKCVQRWASRDDLGTARQLGWLEIADKFRLRARLHHLGTSTQVTW